MANELNLGISGVMLWKFEILDEHSANDRFSFGYKVMIFNEYGPSRMPQADFKGGPMNI